jgi:hypothetical protein
MEEKLTNWKIAALIFLALTLIFTFPLYFSLTKLGIHDWDQHIFYEAIPRATILQYMQFPLWNPWQCGGNVLLANPQSSFLTIHFPLTLLFGEVIGTKLAIPLYLFIGLLGMWFVCKKLQMSPIAAYFPPVILMLSGIYAIRIAVGHTNWFHLAWIPWVFLFYLRTQEKWIYIIPASFLLALIFLGGGIHPFAITGILLGVYAVVTTLTDWKEHKAKPIMIFALLFIVWIPFAAVKLFPMIAVYGEMLPLEQNDIQPLSMAILFDALTNHEKTITDVYYAEYSANNSSVDNENADDPFPWYWHEYYGYIGILPLILFMITAFFLFKKYAGYLLSVVFIFFVMLSQQLSPKMWHSIQSIPFANVFHGPSRFLFSALFFIAVVIGFGISWIENKKIKYAPVLLAVLLLFIVGDLITSNADYVVEGFSIEPTQGIEKRDFYTIYAETEESSSQYQAFLNNNGIWNCYERFHPLQVALPKESSAGEQYGNYHGEAYFYETNEALEISEFSPNKITMKVLNKEGTVMLNQNYVSGWKVIIDGEKTTAINTDGLISAKIRAENKEVVFYYLPNSFIIGLLITLLSVAGASFLFCKNGFGAVL